MSVISNEVEKRARTVNDWSARDMYFSLLSPSGFSKGRADSAGFLTAHLKETSQHFNNMPAHPEQLEAWLDEHTQVVGRQFQEYLAVRQEGGRRWYFSSKAHALYFLRAVAPTKMVDGAWLYGITRHWHDARFASLLKIYLEELGNGVEAMNHVVLYRKLLKVNECEDWKNLDDKFFTQGALQLALAANTETHLPEVIGFNLGYEQLPLHLLITAYELKELNIDPYYFTLHTTIDNPHSGHARAAIDAVTEALPTFGSVRRYMERIMAGVKLNDAGLGTLDIINHFDLHGEVIRVLQNKADIGRYMHSNRCVIEGKTMNEWLADPDQVAKLLYIMQKTGWIKRHQDPEQSRFWQVIAAEKAPMFGVFTAYERQVIYDWIAGDVLETLPRVSRLGPPWRMAEHPMTQPEKQRGNVYDLRSGLRLAELGLPDDDFNQEQLSLERYLHGLGPKRMDFLIDWLSPAKHHTALGLCATRYFKAYMDAPYSQYSRT
ncbi:iron-containing redox enzyme family protein [Methylophilus sp. TWE2]|uniref:iron-containing redox enzyme family protein n=1 Tax=Methylophilus sp. TWE2 TaxID=1662285 RepID=UPI000670D7FB|nr:iron-containing redox enzyme family protein [Methylophilus sp. TWE2]AKR42249.1 hypothetical protein ACJ67_01505 [Methylophilus sp. TWE2]